MLMKFFRRVGAKRRISSTGAFSAQVDTGCAKDPKGRVSENASNQKLGACDLMQSDRITL
jgi:hypothetical protein